MSKPLKSFRVWLTPLQDSSSAITVSVDHSTVELRMSDCHRSIDWTFWRQDAKNLRKARKKIAKVKAVIDAVYAELHRD